MNALLVAQVDDLLLRKAGVVLDLVDSGDDLCVREKLFEIFFAVLLRLSVNWGRISC